MQSLIPDLRKLTQFYFGLEQDLSTALDGCDSGRMEPFLEAILQNRTRLAQVERMSAHIHQLSDDLKRFREKLDKESCREADTLKENAASQAIRIRGLCALATEKIETNRRNLQKELEEIGKGKEYLKSIRPVKYNYPKFIDSTG